MVNVLMEILDGQSRQRAAEAAPHKPAAQQAVHAVVHAGAGHALQHVGRKSAAPARVHVAAKSAEKVQKPEEVIPLEDHELKQF